MLISMDKILNKAREEGYGVVAPNIWNGDTVEAAFDAAIEAKSPLILDCLERLGDLELDIELIAEITKFYCKRYPEVNVALNLDHGDNYDVAVKAIKYGFTSVMVDRSQLEYEENIKEVAEIVKIAHSVGVSVESELGHVGTGTSYDDDRDCGLTNVDTALNFVEKTKVDCLAVAVGTAHGRYVGTPKIDFERLAQLKQTLPVPLVLHGGSSTGDENLIKTVKFGISKINIGTDLITSGAIAVKDNLLQAKYPSLLDVYADGIKGFKSMLIHYMDIFGCKGKN